MISVLEYHCTQPEAFEAGVAMVLFIILFLSFGDLLSGVYRLSLRREVERMCNLRARGQTSVSCHCSWCPGRRDCAFYEKRSFRKFFEQFFPKQKKP